MGELAPLGIGAAGDGVTTAPVPKPGPGSEGTATAVAASLQGCGSLSKSGGDAPPIAQPASAMGGIQLRSCIHRVDGGLVVAGCTHCLLPAQLANPKLNKQIKPDPWVCVRAITAPGRTRSGGSWGRAQWMETALTDWGSLQIPFPTQPAKKQPQRTGRLPTWGLSRTLALQDWRAEVSPCRFGDHPLLSKGAHRLEPGLPVLRHRRDPAHPSAPGVCPPGTGSHAAGKAPSPPAPRQTPMVQEGAWKKQLIP